MAGRADDGAGGFARTVGLRDLLVMSVGGMVGPAVFYYPAVTAGRTGPAAVLAWLLAGVGMIAVALCYTELSTAFPEQGGPAVFPAETVGRRPVVRRFFAFLEGVCYAIGWVFGVSVSAWFVATYLGQVPGLGGVASHPVALAAVAVVASFVVTALGIDLTKRTTLVLTAFILAVLVLVVGAGLGSVFAGDGGEFTPFLTGDALGFLGSMGVALSAYGAWTVIPASAEEVKRPAWTLPRAILGSLVVVTLLYTAVMVVFVAVVPTATITPDAPVFFAPLSVLAGAVGLGAVGDYLVPLAALVAVFTTMLVGITGTARVLLAMGRRGLLPAVFARVDDRTGTPVVGVAVVAAAALCLVFVRGFYGQIVLAALVGTVVPYVINVVALVGLRRYRPDVTPTFEAPGGLVLPAVALCFLGSMAVGLGVERPLTAGLVVGGVVVGFVLREVAAGAEERGTAASSDD
ncbi:APC family permease [Halococcus hamelinensis]|uniref:Ethanolamine transporter n=1 Tax=Halococcus hamelinensis 100A6 TaxID=1132509 RepID=M0M4D0_9EURY|nr:APC family permease [Halococcus hamelinensis]EMA40667.1 ethanolamine transporter [Halococcus hamelinensis 100A6]